MSALRSYWKSEMEEWEATKSDPVDTFADNLQFGLTGPAPSLNDDLSINHGKGVFGEINQRSFQSLDDAAKRAGGKRWRWYLRGIAALAVVYVLGTLFDIQIGG